MTFRPVWQPFWNPMTNSSLCYNQNGGVHHGRRSFDAKVVICTISILSSLKDSHSCIAWYKTQSWIFLLAILKFSGMGHKQNFGFFFPINKRYFIRNEMNHSAWVVWTSFNFFSFHCGEIFVTWPFRIVYFLVSLFLPFYELLESLGIFFVQNTENTSKPLKG